MLRLHNPGERRVSARCCILSDHGRARLWWGCVVWMVFTAGWLSHAATVEAQSATEAKTTPVAATALAVNARPATPPQPWDLQPYRVQIQFAWGEGVDLPSSTRTTIQADLLTAVERILGAEWNTTLTLKCEFSPASTQGIERLTAQQLSDSWQTITRDKTFLVCVDQHGALWDIASREWDHTARDLGPVAHSQLADVRGLARAILQQLHGQFRPLARVVDIEPGQAVVHVLGGGLPPADPECRQLRVGQFWRPFYRFRSKTEPDVVEKLQEVPWTMLRTTELTEVELGRASCRVISGIRVPLTNRRRPQIDLFALQIRPTLTFTELRTVSQRDLERPLVGLTVDVRPDVPLPGDDKPAQPAPLVQKLITNRLGTATVLRQPGEPLVWLTIKSHDKVLARLPLLTGMSETATAELPDHALVLATSGELSILESRLTDAVAQRAVLIARIKQLAQLGQWDETKPLRRELALLPGVDLFLKDLTAIRLPAVQAARSQNDKAAAATIERLCRETSLLIQKYLDEEKIKTFEEELSELQKEMKAKGGSGPLPKT